MTTFDFFKTFAVIFMIVDHVGFYFITPPLESDIGDPALWFRVFGRFCVPIWFFLIGYARSRAIPVAWGVGAAILVAVNVMTGMFILPLNALVSMIVIRVVIDPVARVMFRDFRGMMAVFFLLSLVYFPTNDLVEYGSVGLLIALMGYAVRAQRDGMGIPVLQSALSYGAFLAAGVGVVMMSQYMSFRFDFMQFIVASVGIILVFVVLIAVRPVTYLRLTPKLPQWLGAGIRVCGRRTMEIYVVHLTLFKISALVFGLGYPIYGWFDWDYMIYGAFRNVN